MSQCLLHADRHGASITSLGSPFQYKKPVLALMKIFFKNIPLAWSLAVTTPGNGCKVNRIQKWRRRAVSLYFAVRGSCFTSCYAALKGKDHLCSGSGRSPSTPTESCKAFWFSSVGNTLENDLILLNANACRISNVCCLFFFLPVDYWEADLEGTFQRYIQRS